MRLLATLIAAAAAAAVMILTNPTFAAAPLKRIANAAGNTVAVLVRADATLEYSRQYFDADPANLLTELAIPPGHALKLNVVAATPAAADAARQAIQKHFPASARPAVSVVVGAMPRPDVTVGIDAVSVASSADPAAANAEAPGARIYVSGQAELIAKSPAEATAKTLEGLQETLTFLGCKPADVVQAKCFLTPMSAMPQVLREFERALPELGHRIVFVEWKSNLPIEIELIVQSPTAPPADAPAVEYLTPPGKTASPLFARVVRVNRGDMIYIGDIASAKPASGAEQVTSIFEQLQEILKQTNSDLRHLVKATYYVSDDDASKQLTVIRPKFYDPKRPPAASKAMVPAVGIADRSITIDMIAVPTTQPAKP